MPVPKRKRSRPRRDKRFANKGIKVKSFISCANCQESLLPHRACQKCGFYKGVKVIETKSDRGTKRTQDRQARAPKNVQAEQNTQEQEG